MCRAGIASQRLPALVVKTHKGGAYWLGTEETLAPRRHQNLVFLHARRRAFPTFAAIAPEILALWRAGAGIPVAELVARFSHRWSEAEVEAAAWKIAGDAAAAGHLVVDLVAEPLDLSTPIALLHPDESPILPEPLPDTLDRSSVDAEAPIHTSDTWPGMQEHDDSPLVTQDVPGPTVDASAITPDDARAAFLRNLAAVTDVAQGRPLRAAAADHGIDPGHLCRLVRRAREHGQPALVSYRSYHRDRALRPEFRDLIRKLYARPLRPSVTAVHEDVALKRLADELTTRDGCLVRLPSYAQVYRYIRSIDDEPAVATARSGLAHPPQPRTSPTSFVRSIAAPALLCQVDDYHLDIVVVARDGTPITRRVWGAVLVCVKTAAILGAVLSLDVLREEDYMRLVKQALEPKESLVALYACQHAWPCSAKPSVIFHDRGKIFTSERAAQVLVDRLGIVTEQAPPYAPTAKGTVEAIFTWVTRKFTHRLPGTTKSNPAARGAYDSAAEARAAGITIAPRFGGVGEPLVPRRRAAVTRPHGLAVAVQTGPHDAQDGDGEQDGEGHIGADEGGGEERGHDMEGERGGMGQRGEKAGDGAGEGAEDEGVEAERPDTGAGLRVGHVSLPWALAHLSH